MISNEQDHALLIAQGDAHLVPTTSSGATSGGAARRTKMGWGQRIVVVILLTVVLVPPTAAFYSFFMGVPLHLLAKNEEEKEKKTTKAAVGPTIVLVSGQAHTLDVPPEVCASLGIVKDQQDAIAVAQVPATMRPLVLPGSTGLDPTRTARVRARFAPARVVSLGQVWDYARKTGHTEFRELRQGDSVTKGELLGTFYSVDVGSKKNDLLDALVQLELDQKIMERVEKNRYSVPEVYYLTQQRAVQTDRNAINRALNNLKLWDIPQDEIDALHAEAQKIAADKDGWLKTQEGRWVNREKQATNSKGMGISGTGDENPWGRVTLRAPFDGVIVERNVHVGEMVVDNTVNLFQISDVNRLLVVANCPEDELPTLEALRGNERRWTIQTVGARSAEGLSGTIDEIGYVIDPNQHTAVIKGYVDNPARRIRAGQYVTATINIPPPDDVVEIPSDALVDDGLQALVFIQPDPGVHRFTMRRVQVTNRFEHSVFVRATPLPQEKRQLTAQEVAEGLLPIEPLHAGERVLLSGAVELKAVVMDLKTRPEPPQAHPEPKPEPSKPAANPPGARQAAIEAGISQGSHTDRG
jgi:cobalt-zinc-cadmium efflux system membrane fusion protein